MAPENVPGALTKGADTAASAGAAGGASVRFGPMLLSTTVRPFALCRAAICWSRFAPDWNLSAVEIAELV